MKIFRHTLTVFLSLMVFITSSGFTVNLHYCGDSLQEISINNHAGCQMKKASLPKGCEDNSNVTSIKKANNCCKNQQIKTKSENKLLDNKAKKETSFDKTLAFINSYFISLFNFNTSDEDKKEENDTSVFPLLKAGLYILLQQFRN